MFENKAEFNKLISTSIAMLHQKGNQSISDVLKHSNVIFEHESHDNWNGGIDGYNVIIEVEINVFTQIEGSLSEMEKEIIESFKILLRGQESEYINEVVIRPVIQHVIDWGIIADTISKKGLIEKLEIIKTLMVSVSTGGQKIQSTNTEYKKLYMFISDILSKVGIDNPNPYSDLWSWYGKWSSGELPTYQLRRIFIKEMYEETLNILNKSDEFKTVDQPFEPTGWARVDRGIFEMRSRIKEASVEEQFQAIGMLGRETIISLAQAVYDKDLHKSLDGIEPSNTDAERMMEAYISYTLLGGTNERIRKYAKSALELANEVTHDRTADIHDASLCLISVISLVNIIKVLTKQTIIRF